MGWTIKGQNSDISKRFFSRPSKSSLTPTQSLHNKYRALLPGRQSGRSVKLTTQLHPVPRLTINVPGTQFLLYVLMAVYRDKEIVIAYKTAPKFQ